MLDSRLYLHAIACRIIVASGKLPGNEQYIGPLSRFNYSEKENKCDLLVSISGPEPQRTIFEKIVFNQVAEISGRIIIVRGKPGIESVPYLNENVIVFNHLPGDELQNKIAGASLVLARSGYSTIMDLVMMQKKAILVPTPGQTEQEYLGDHLSRHKMFYVVQQEKLNLAEDLKKVNLFSFVHDSQDFRQFESAVDKVLELIREK